MEIDVFDVRYDNVIKSNCIIARVDYKYAIENLVPLRDKFDSQRYTLKSKLYKKLERDIENGCIIPPITIGIDVKEKYEKLNLQQAKNVLESNIHNAFILDGIQRLNILNNINKRNPDIEGILYLNIIISNSMDRLLYRMITLNNGQKPMSARHQIEVLAKNIYRFDELDIYMQTEKEEKEHNYHVFKKEDIIKAYISFISESTNIDNQKIIDSKLDELITEKIIDSNIPERGIEFLDVINIVNKFLEDKYLCKWFKVSNNLIGFCAGINKSYDILFKESIDDFQKNICKIEESLTYFNLSKIKLTSIRRNAIKYFIENYLELRELDPIEILDRLSIRI